MSKEAQAIQEESLNGGSDHASRVMMEGWTASQEAKQYCCNLVRRVETSCKADQLLKSAPNDLCSVKVLSLSLVVHACMEDKSW